MPEIPDPAQSDDFMGGYGVQEERRIKIIKMIAATVITVLIVGSAAYFYFRTWSEERIISRFVDSVDRQDLDAAYAMWCPPDSPCPYYSRARFEEDWGAAGLYPKVADAQIRYVDYCDSGVVFNFDYRGASQPLALRVEREDGKLGFAPEARCPGRHLNFRAFWNSFFSPAEQPPMP